jgi:hypothetical protein
MIGPRSSASSRAAVPMSADALRAVANTTSCQMRRVRQATGYAWPPSRPSMVCAWDNVFWILWPETS